ncbi:MAG: ATP-binding protein [Peptococcaceae bacterium]|nr:ATP-binding protein [Peptococcaceae bacterium]
MQQTMQTTQLHMELTTLEQLADVIVCLQEQLKQWNISEEKQVDIKLCIMEAVQNALLHGGSEMVLPKARVMWKCDAEQFYFTVEDNGAGIPLDIRENEYTETLKESGRGLLLMHAILDEVSFNETGNAITGILRW